MVGNAIAQAEALAPGLRVGRYELIQRLAAGGMAEIYLARATGIEGFEKLVVLKRILPQLASNPDFVAMFLDEARLSACLEHPNVAQVHDIGEHEGSYFFTMEYVRGQDLRAILKHAVATRRRVPLEHALTIVLGAAAGLHAAHDKHGFDGQPLDIVHRDVSPSNVLVSYDGGVKVVDFGVAKAAHRQSETRTGTLKGKVAYMSPEQCTGGAVDRRSDIFALGILLYELTTCRRLFKGDSEFEIMSQIVHRDVEPPSRSLRWYPGGLERILLRALRRSPAERYPTAQAMQVELEELARSQRLAISTVTLGAFMRESFVERMREQDSAVSRRARTEEVTGEVSESIEPEDELELEIEIELGEDPAPARWRGWPAVLSVLLMAGAVTIGWQRWSGSPPAAEHTRPAPARQAPAPAAAHPPETVAGAVSADEAPSEIAPAPVPPPEDAPAEPPPAAAPSEPAPAASRDQDEPTKRRTRRPRARPRAATPPPPAPSPSKPPSPAPASTWDLDSPLPPSP